MRSFAVACVFAALLATSPAAAQTAPAAPTPATETLRSSELVADYFAADPATASRGAVVVLGGSEGGLGGSRPMARRLAAEGFDAIAVSYFGEAGQSANLDRVPIEPVGRAIDWLRARPDGDEPVAIIGVSKGAELALLIASRDPRITAVAVGVPSSVVWQGIDQTGGETGSSWTQDGRPLPYAAYDMSNGFQGIFRLYQDSLESAPAEAQIPVERIAGPILMISAEDDGLWPSADMARRIEARLRAAGFAHAVEHKAYENAGHGVFGPPIGSPSPGLQQQLAFLGGTVEGVTAARADGWPRLTAFLRAALED